MKTRLFVSAALGNGVELRLDGEPARYLGRALRLKPGEAIAVFNGDDGEWSATIDRLGRNDVVLTIGEPIDNDVESPLDVHLVQGVSRGERMDFVVQKATELGVRRITPVLTHHGVVKLDERRAGRRREHWQGVAISASEQSGRTRPPRIDPPLPLNEWFGQSRSRDVTGLILSPEATRPLTALDAAPTKLCLMVGPEGGFSEREYEDAGVAGFDSVSLGPRTLRTETAAVTAIAIVQSAWGDVGS